MTKMRSCSLVLLMSLVSGALTQEILQNPDFEDSDTNFQPWYCNGDCTVDLDTDSYSGKYSAKVTGRTSIWNRIQQTVSLQTNVRYKLTAFVKLLNVEPGAMYQAVELMTSCLKTDGSRYWMRFGKEPYTSAGEWIQVGAIRKLTQGADDCRVYVQVKGLPCDYLVDSLSLTEVTDNPNILTEAASSIDDIRKADIKFSLTGYDQGKYSVEVIQTELDFPFGSAVGAREIVDPAFHRYQDVFYENYNWAVIENQLKWAQMEYQEGEVDTQKALTALSALTRKGVKVRGHCVFWAVEKKIQNWVKAKTAQEVEELVAKRISDVVPVMKDYLDHWDVNNENLHGDWFEQKLQNPNTTMDMFYDVRQYDPDVKLFLNDYAILNKDYAMALKNQANRFMESGAPIDGIGIQSHLKSSDVDLDTIKGCLDIVAEAGLPIVITELSIEEPDADKKAQMYRDVLTLYYGHPAVAGILMWGFWDGKLWAPDSKLFEGDNVTANAAGEAYKKLYHETWRTTEKVWWGKKDGQRVRSGFTGKYKLILRKWRRALWESEFALGQDGAHIQVALGGTDGPTVTVSPLNN